MAKNYVTNFRGEESATPNMKYLAEDEPMTSHESYCLSFENHSFETNGMRKSLSHSDLNDLRALQAQAQGQQDASHRCRRSMTPPPSESPTNFITLAKRIYHWQRHVSSRSLRLLISILRSRPVHFPTLKEIEEIRRKHKIKANPIPKAVIEGSHLTEVPKKLPTIPELFDLTEVQAQPAPEHILEKPDIPLTPVTQSITPKSGVLSSSTALIKQPGKLVVKAPKPCKGPILLEPFSFEKRDEEYKRCHDEKLRKQIEKEKNLANQFKARLSPLAVRKMIQSVAERGESTKSSESDKENQGKFDARPTTVLHRSPYKSVLGLLQQTKPECFGAAEREIFDQQMKEKEEQWKKIQLRREQALRGMESKAQAQLRAMLCITINRG